MHEENDTGIGTARRRNARICVVAACAAWRRICVCDAGTGQILCRRHPHTQAPHAQVCKTNAQRHALPCSAHLAIHRRDGLGGRGGGLVRHEAEAARAAGELVRHHLGLPPGKYSVVHQQILRWAPQLQGPRQLMTERKKTEAHSSETSARIAQKRGMRAQARDSNHPQRAGPRRDRTSRTRPAGSRRRRPRRDCRRTA